jgi:hypothetical protein
MPETGISVDFCWRNYLNLAKELAKTTDDEAYLRSSISRAYYAAFCNARNFMINNDKNQMPDQAERGNMSAHTYLILYFKGVFSKGMIKSKKRRKTKGPRHQIGEDLDSMRKDREKVDYYDYVSNNVLLRSTVEDVLIRSERVVSHTEKGGF